MKIPHPRHGKLTDVTELDYEALSEYCAWNTESERDLLWRFIVEKDLVKEAEKWLCSKAIEEIATASNL